jgi:hypothetical protein
VTDESGPSQGIVTAGGSNYGTGGTAVNTVSGGTGSVTVASGGRGFAAGARTCPDETSFQPTLTPVSRSLGNYADHYTPSCKASVGSSDFTLAWWVSQPGTYLIDTLGSQADTILAVYAGLCSSKEVACNDDDAYGTSRQSRAIVTVASPDYLTIAVDGYRGSTSDFLLEIVPIASTIDTVLPSELPTITSASTLGRRDRFTSTCNGKTSSGDYVFTFQAPATGTFVFAARSIMFDPVLSLRRDGPAGDELACNDDVSVVSANSSVTVALVAGAIVAVVVDGFEGNSGDFELLISRDDSDTGSCCSASNSRLGCLDAQVAECVCASQSACCRQLWDPSCVLSVANRGCGSCP